MKIKPFKEAHTKASRSLLKKNKKEKHFSFFMFNYIISDNSVTYKTQILCTHWLSGRVLTYGPSAARSLLHEREPNQIHINKHFIIWPLPAENFNQNRTQ